MAYSMQQLLGYFNALPQGAQVGFNNAMSGSMFTPWDSALHAQWGQGANNWINSADASGYQASFDPTTGGWQYRDPTTGAWQQGSISGWDSSQFDPGAGQSWLQNWANTGNSGVSQQTYDPNQWYSMADPTGQLKLGGSNTGQLTPGTTGTGLNAAQGITVNPNGTYSQYMPTTTSTTATRTTGTNTTSPFQMGTTSRTPTGTTPDPFQVPAGTLYRGHMPTVIPGVTPGTTAPPGTPNGAPGVAQPGVSPVPRSTTPAPGTPPAGVPSRQNNGADPSAFPTADAEQFNATQWSIPEYLKTPWDFFNDPGYQFALSEGEKAIQNSAAAKGGLLSGATLKDLSTYGQNTAQKFYQDAYNNYNVDRNFAQNQALDERNFNNSNLLDARNFNNQNRMWDTSFNNNNRIDARNFDQSAAIDARNYQTDLDKYNQNFGYTQDMANRAFQTNTLMDLARMGLQGTQGDASLASALAGILSQNTMNGAGAGAAATQGQATNLSNMLSQIFSYLNNNSMVNNFLPYSPTRP